MNFFYASFKSTVPLFVTRCLLGSVLLLTTLFSESLVAQTCKVTDYIYLNDPQDYNTQGFVHKLKIGTGGTLTEIANANGTTPWFPQGGGLGSPHGLGQDLNGNLYIGANPGVGPIAKIKCNGTVDNLNFINDGGFNIVSKDGFLYVSSASSNHINRYALCDGSLQGYVSLNGVLNQPYVYNSGNQTDWGLDIASDGTIYATLGFEGDGMKAIYRFKPTNADFVNHTDYMPLVSDTDVPPGTNAAGLNMGKAWIWGITHDDNGNMYVVAEEPWFTNSDLIPISWVLKYDANGNLIGSLSEREDTPTGGFEGARGIVYYPTLNRLYIAAGVDGDCVAMIDPNTMTYMGAAAAHVPNQVPKTLRIASEACPVAASSVVDTTLCNVSVGDKIFLQQIIGACNAPICGGTWVADPANAGMTFNQCDLSFNVSSLSGCGKFTLSNVGGTCGDFTVELRIGFIDIKAPVIGGSQTVCSTQDPAAFTIITPASSSGTLSYQWQKSTTSCTSGFSDIAGANNSTYDPPITTQTTYYRVVTSGTGSCTSPTNKCSDISNCVTLTVFPKMDAGADVAICLPKTTVNLADAPAGGEWVAQAGNPAVATINANTGVITGLTAVGTYQFILQPIGNTSCSDTMKVVVSDGGVANVLCNDGTTSYTLTANASATNVVWFNMAGVQVGTGATLFVNSKTSGLEDGTEAFYYTAQNGSLCDVEACCPVKFVTEDCCPVIPYCTAIGFKKN
jgi:hypothetical protein